MHAERHPWLTAFAVLSIIAGLMLIAVPLFFADAFLADLDPVRASQGFKRWGGLQGYQKGIALLCMLPGLVLAGALAVLWISMTNKRRSR